MAKNEMDAFMHHTRRQTGMSHTRQLGPNFYPGRSEIDSPYTAYGPVTTGLPHGIYSWLNSAFPIALRKIECLHSYFAPQGQPGNISLIEVDATIEA